MFAVNLEKELGVRELRKCLGCTQRMFAQITGTSERNVIRWEAKAVRPNTRSRSVLHKIEELCKILSDIFKKNTKISEWFNTPNKSLNGRTPIKQIISANSPEEGIEEIIDLLNGFKLGMACFKNA